MPCLLVKTAARNPITVTWGKKRRESRRPLCTGGGEGARLWVLSITGSGYSVFLPRKVHTLRLHPIASLTRKAKGAFSERSRSLTPARAGCPQSWGAEPVCVSSASPQRPCSCPRRPRESCVGPDRGSTGDLALPVWIPAPRLVSGEPLTHDLTESPLLHLQNGHNNLSQSLGRDRWR